MILLRWLLLLPLVERHGDDARADHSATHVNLNLSALLGVLGGDVRHAYVLLEVRRGAARRDLPDLRALDVNVLPVARDASVRHLESDELAPDSFFLLTRERLAPVEVALCELRYPAEVRFQERRLIRNLVAVERHTRFEPERVARREAAGK